MLNRGLLLNSEYPAIYIIHHSKHALLNEAFAIQPKAKGLLFFPLNKTAEGGMDTTGRSAEDQEVEIAALTFECRVAVEAVVLRTKRLERIPASPTLKPSLSASSASSIRWPPPSRILHGAIIRFLCPQDALAPDDLPSASHRDIEEVGASVLCSGIVTQACRRTSREWPRPPRRICLSIPYRTQPWPACHGTARDPPG